MFKRILLAAAIFVGLCVPAAAQQGGGVVVFPPITPGDCASWRALNILQDAGSACGTGSGTVTSISNSDSTLTLTPNPIVGTGTISLNLGHANTWSNTQTFADGGAWSSTGIVSTLPASLGNVNVTSAAGVANGFNLSAANNIGFSSNNSNRFNLLGNAFFAANSAGAELQNLAASGTVATVCPNRTSCNYGVGGDGSTKVSLIANSVDVGDIFSYGIADHGAPGASQSALLLDGALLTGGTGTTNLPGVLIQPSGTTAATGWSTAGTGLGMNLASGFTGNYLDFRLGGGSTNFSVSAGGTILTGGSFSTTSGAISLTANRTAVAWTTSGLRIAVSAHTDTDSTSSGTVAAIYDNALLAPTLAFSNATTVSNAYNTYFVDPVAGTNATLTAKWALGADSANIGGNQITSGGISSAGSFVATAGSSIAWNSRAKLSSPADGIITALNTAGSGFTRLNLGGTTSSFGALQTNGTETDSELADGSGLAPFGMSNLRSTGSVTLTGLTTGTNADFLCLSAANVVLLQTSACTISSLRFKRDVRHFTASALATINLLDVDTFYYKAKNKDPNGNGKQLGLIAEDVAKKAPVCAEYENDMKTPKSYKQECVIALLVKGMQEQQAQIANDNQRIEMLEKKLSRK